MNRKTVSGIMLTLLLMSVLILAFNIQPVKAEGGITIRPDGSVYPPTAPVTTSDNITYTFTGNIRDTVVIQRSNITVDGAGYKLQGYGVWYGFDCRANNVTIKNTNIFNFSWGIILRTQTKYSTICRNNIASNGFGVWVVGSSNNTIFGNTITNNDLALRLDHYSQSNVVYGNNLFLNVHGGVHIYDHSSHNTVFGNNITSNIDSGISIEWYSHSNTIFGNHIVENSRGVLVGLRSQNNVFYHNSFVDNIHQVIKYDDSANIWDDGYPSGGNYWSDYNGTDLFSGPHQDETGCDGIGDTPYVIDVNDQDNYPLMNHWTPTSPVITATIDICPDTLNLKSNGEWITGYIELSESYNVEDIDVSTVTLNNTIPVDRDAPTQIGDYDLDSVPDLMVKFDRTSIIEWLGTMDYSEDTGKSYLVTFTITGKVLDTVFEGSDTTKALRK